LVPHQFHPRTGEIDVSLTPEVHGFHKVSLFYDSAVVSGQMGFDCSPEPTAKVIGDQVRNDSAVGNEYTIRVGSINCKLDNFKFAVKGPNGAVVASLNIDPSKDQGINTKFTPHKGAPPNPNGVENGIWDLKFVPKFGGAHTVLCFLNGKPVQNSPVTVNVQIDDSYSVGKTQRVNMATNIDQGSNAIKAGDVKSPRPVSQVLTSSNPSVITTSPRVTQISATPRSTGSSGSNSPDTIRAKTPSSSAREKDTSTIDSGRGDSHRTKKSPSSSHTSSKDKTRK